MQYFSSLVWVVCENHGFEQVKGLTSHQLLAARGAVLTNYFSITHPSGPNYRSMAAGHYFTHDELLGQSRPTVVTQTGVPATVWHYKGQPARRHNPLLDLSAPFTTTTELDVEALPESCIVYAGMDDSNNAHSGPLAVADKNLLDLIERLDGSEWFNRAVGDRYPALVVTWDEAYTASNQVFSGWLGRGVAAGATCADKLNHFSFCRLMCENWQQPPLEQAAQAAPITGIWNPLSIEQ